MDKLYVAGGARLDGTIKASGSKNATLAIFAASLLAKGRTVLSNVPRIGDIYTMIEMLRSLGVKCEINGDDVVTIDATELKSSEAPYELVKKMRASFTVLGQSSPGRVMPRLRCPADATSVRGQLTSTSKAYRHLERI